MFLPSLSDLGLSDQSFLYIELTRHVMPKAAPTTRRTRHSMAAVPSSQSESRLPRRSREWPPEWDEKLLEARRQGTQWPAIATKFRVLGHIKSGNACRKRHERLMSYQRNVEWNGKKLRLLAQLYEAKRKEIWAPIAQEMNEDWSLIEGKCMEYGLKGLQDFAGNLLTPEGSDDGSDSDDLVQLPEQSTARTYRRHTMGGQEIAAINHPKPPRQFTALVDQPEHRSYSTRQSYAPHPAPSSPMMSQPGNSHDTRQSFGPLPDHHNYPTRHSAASFYPPPQPPPQYARHALPPPSVPPSSYTQPSDPRRSEHPRTSIASILSPTLPTTRP